MKRFICTLTLLLVTSTLSANVVTIPDPNLRAALYHTLGLPNGAAISVRDMESLTEFRAVGADITDLSGLEHSSGLRKLHVGGNRISDISPLGALTNLESVNLRNNQISDISAIGNLTKLTYLKLRDNQVANLAPLSHCAQLAILTLSKNQVTDVGPLAHLSQLTHLNLNENKISDVRALAHLTQLVELDLGENQIADVRPLANLTQLRSLSLVSNPILDVSALDGLSLEHFAHDSYGCDMMPLPLAPRIESRNFPSIFTAWSDKDRWPLFDLIFCCPRFGMRLVDTHDGVQFRTPNPSWDEPIRIRDAYLSENPNMVFLHGVSAIIHELDSLPEDSPYWLRDKHGGIVVKWEIYGLMDLNHPGWQQKMIDMAVTIDRCGLYDGIFIDVWGKGEHPGQTAILRGIRERVRDNFLIMVNTNDNQAPDSAPYINGLFMETGFPEKRTEPEDIEAGLVKVENTLRWAVESLQEPRIIGLEGSNYRYESPHTPRNMQWMRATTTLGLTFSDGYVAFPLRGGPWYDFWNADLGRPIGEKSALYDEDIPGLYIREYTNGWAVYNHSGEAQIVTLPEETRSAANGRLNTNHAVLNLDGDIFLRIPPKLPGDLNGDGVVNILDLTIVARAIGTDKREGDVNGDGVINVFDLVFVANQF